jgi:hypothetical protein
VRKDTGKTGAGSGEASAKPEEAVLTEVAAQRHQADASEQEIEKPPMRPSDISFAAPWTCNRHGPKSPENLGGSAN